MVWNVNALSQHFLEVEIFLEINNVDTKKYVGVSNYNLYHTLHMDGKIYGGFIIKSKK